MSEAPKITMPEAARLGDRIQCYVRHPYAHTITMELATRESVAYANELLMDPKSGWRLAAIRRAAEGAIKP